MKYHKAFVTLTAPLKEQVLAEADEQGTNMTDVIVAKVAAHYGVAFEPSGLPSTRRTGLDQLDVVLRMPVPLYQVIVRQSFKTTPRTPITRIVRSILETAYERTPA